MSAKYKVREGGEKKLYLRTKINVKRHESCFGTVANSCPGSKASKLKNEVIQESKQRNLVFLLFL